VFVNGKRTTALRDIPIGSRACCVVTLNGLGGSDALTHVFAFTELPATRKLQAK